MPTPFNIQKYFILILFTLIFSVTSFAAPDEDDSFLSMVGQEIISPVTTPAWPWLVGGAVTTALLASVLKDDVVYPLQDEFARTKPLGGVSKVGYLGGTLFPNAVYAAGMYANYYFNDDTRSKKRAILMFKASLYSMSLTTGLKPAIGQTRPDGTDQLSFPSGHATGAFAFAGMIMAEHEFWPWGISALALSTVTAASRINDNRHYLHDVLGGATIGLAYGLGLSYLYKVKDERDTSSNAKDFSSGRELLILPSYSPEFKGLSMVMGF